MFVRSFESRRQDVLIKHKDSLDSTIRRYRSAVEQLIGAFFDERPVAIVVGSGHLGPAHVLAKFLDLAAEEAEIATINGPCTNASDFMRQIVRSIGFEPNQLSLHDLESVLDLFLMHQRNGKRRTIIAVQDFDSHGWWVLDKIRRLIEDEAEQKNGLMLLLSGPPSANVVLDEPVLDVIAAHAGERIVLAPFTLPETRDFVRNHLTAAKRTESAQTDIDEVIDFYATTIIHEYCQGVPDDVYRVCNECLKLLNDEGETRITSALAKEALIAAGLAEAETEPEEEIVEQDVSDTEMPDYLVIEAKGEPTQHIPLNGANVIIGRDQLCDHSIIGLKVSRFHSLFSMTPEGPVVADLGSTNGTFVNGEKVERYAFDEDDVVEVGHARIKFVPSANDNGSESDEDLDGHRLVDEDPFPESSINFVGHTLKHLKTE